MTFEQTTEEYVTLTQEVADLLQTAVGMLEAIRDREIVHRSDMAKLSLVRSQIVQARLQTVKLSRRAYDRLPQATR